MKPEDKTIPVAVIPIFSIILVVGIIVAGWYAPKGWNWALIAALMLAFMIALGAVITGRPLGILINERKLMSLSRFQIALWTLIILSAYFTVALERIKDFTVDDPLAIEIDWRLWALIGISAASLVGTPLIQSSKRRKTPDDKNYKATSEALVEDKEIDENYVKDNSDGLLYGNKETSDAQFTDMFEGDELKNTAYVDMSKVQMFFFTIIAAISYVVLLTKMIVTQEPDDMSSLPPLSEGLLAILGISHAGYLGSKSIDHTKIQ